MTEEITPRSLGTLELDDSVLLSSGPADGIGMAFGLAGNVGFGVFATLLNITSDIESIARSLGDGQAVVESDAARNSTESDDGTPHLVGRFSTDAVAAGEVWSGRQGSLETDNSDQGEDTGGKLTDTLHGEDGALEHGSLGINLGKLGISLGQNSPSWHLSISSWRTRT